MTDTKDIGAPSKWIPMADPVKLAALGKLCEELNECGVIISRCIIQGMLGTDPDTGVVNRDALIDEMADVMGVMQTAMKYAVKLTTDEAERMLKRSQRKMEMKDAWMEMLK